SVIFGGGVTKAESLSRSLARPGRAFLFLRLLKCCAFGALRNGKLFRPLHGRERRLPSVIFGWGVTKAESLSRSLRDREGLFCFFACSNAAHLARYETESCFARFTIGREDY